MKSIAIVYKSTHHGNTKKVLDRIKAAYTGVDLIDASDFSIDILKNYVAVGFASGIYGFRFHAKIEDALSKFWTSELKKVFFIYTNGGMVSSKLPQKLEQLSQSNGKEFLGSFTCKGYDTFGPLKLVGGIHKDRPNEDDFKNAINFFEKISSKIQC